MAIKAALRTDIPRNEPWDAPYFQHTSAAEQFVTFATLQRETTETIFNLVVVLFLLPQRGAFDPLCSKLKEVPSRDRHSFSVANRCEIVV